MKSIKHVAAVAALVATPLAAFAQQTYAPANNSLTRAEVRQDLIDVQRAGYNQSVGDQTSYPREAQAAEARIGAQQIRAAEASSGYGGVMPGSSASGGSQQPMQPANTPSADGEQPVYYGK
ncbi:DUF4148 domain-containing protein [Paraburkholderia sp. SARCC-3016]|uniref:DUF4148 domain-containing protein n=1 Tax=Paraburkholderia sp. SARCC-3016 TaxID=3058611 RepID=UPI00280A03A6|nr:DUF4148 domain-containing protein [Paraburkholderia sp. SARCC-3016]MDQ7978443.1 DUF4148 domain-containing protein [Paraburkholderia sp. SARCC-3016]